MSCLLAICLALGITANAYDTLNPSQSYHFKAGNEVYGWASYEDQTVRLLGQKVSDVALYGVGIGFEYDVKKFSIFGEAGYAILDDQTNPGIADEIVYVVLSNNHGIRKPPANDPQFDDASHTSYELSNGFIGRVGVGYQYGHIKVTAAYRFLSVVEHYELWNDDVRYGKYRNGHWQESHGSDLSAFELGLWWEF